MEKQLAVVILNYNGAAYLKQFLPSVIHYSPGCRIIVADNASTDNSEEVLKNDFPEVEILQLPTNLGFAGGYNAALKQIDTSYYLLLNSDVEVSKNWLSPMLELLEKNKTAAACQPKIRAYHQPSHFEYAGAAGGYLDWLAYPFCRGRIFDTLEEDKGQYEEAAQVFWTTGACMLVRKEAYWQCGGFDEDFFAHMEEIDLCWRMQAAGWQLWAEPKSTVFHVGGGTLPQGNPRKTYLNFRNGFWMLLKNSSLSELLLKIPARLLLDWVAAVNLLRQGDNAGATAVLKAHRDTVRGVEKLYKKWYQNKKNRLTKAPLFSGSIIYRYFVRKQKKFSQLGITPYLYKNNSN